MYKNTLVHDRLRQGVYKCSLKEGVCFQPRGEMLFSWRMVLQYCAVILRMCLTKRWLMTVFTRCCFLGLGICAIYS